MLSTRDLSSLPELGQFRRLCQSLATLDAILCPEWQYRYYSFNSKWADGQEMASMRDGCGDSYFILFTEAGAILKGLAHNSAAWQKTLDFARPLPGVFDQVPVEFANFLCESAFSIQDTTFCIWRRRGDPSWQVGAIEPLDGEDPDGSAELLRLLDGDPEAYRTWAEDYFETSVARSAADHIYAHRPLTDEIVKALNPELSLVDLEEDLAEIAYPTLMQ